MTSNPEPSRDLLVAVAAFAAVSGGTTHDKAEFAVFIGRIQSHWHFVHFKQLLESLAPDFPNRVSLLATILWQAWRASTWSGVWTAEDLTPRWFVVKNAAADTADHLMRLALAIERGKVDGLKFIAAGLTVEELRAQAATLMRCSDSIENALLTDAQHGPFIYRGGISTARRLPTVPTMLSAQIALLFRRLKLPTDWVFLSELLSVSGIDAPAPWNLRNACAKLIKAVESGEIFLIAWPQDCGRDIKSVDQFRRRNSMQTPFAD